MTDKVVVREPRPVVIRGEHGPQGVQGPVGPQGPEGPQGPQGPAGEVTQAELDAHAADTTLHGGGGSERPMQTGHYYFPSTTNSSIQSNGLGGTNGYSFAIPIWLPAITITSLGIRCQTAANAATYDARLGIYRSNAGGIPDALLVDAGVVSLLTVGPKSAVVNVTVSAGLYWLMMVPQNITGFVEGPVVVGIQQANFEEIPIGNLNNLHFSRGFLYAPDLTGALPATYPYVKDSFGQSPPLIGVGV